MNGLADVDGFKICIQVCMWLGFPPLIVKNDGYDGTPTQSVRGPDHLSFSSLNSIEYTDCYF